MCCCCDCGCILRGLIYMTAVIVLILSIVVLTLDLHSKADGNDTTLTGTYWGLAAAMAVSAIPAVYHYYSPRLIYIALMVLLSAVFFPLRTMARNYRFNFVCVTLVNAILGCLYFYWSACHNEEPEEASGWKTFTKVESSSANFSSDRDRGRGGGGVFGNQYESPPTPPKKKLAKGRSPTVGKRTRQKSTRRAPSKKPTATSKRLSKKPQSKAPRSLRDMGF